MVQSYVLLPADDIYRVGQFLAKLALSFSYLKAVRSLTCRIILQDDQHVSMFFMTIKFTFLLNVLHSILLVHEEKVTNVPMSPSPGECGNVYI